MGVSSVCFAPVDVNPVAHPSGTIRDYQKRPRLLDMEPGTTGKRSGAGTLRICWSAGSAGPKGPRGDAAHENCVAAPAEPQPVISANVLIKSLDPPVQADLVVDRHTRRAMSPERAESVRRSKSRQCSDGCALTKVRKRVVLRSRHGSGEDQAADESFPLVDPYARSPS